MIQADGYHHDGKDQDQHPLQEIVDHGSFKSPHDDIATHENDIEGVKPLCCCVGYPGLNFTRLVHAAKGFKSFCLDLRQCVYLVELFELTVFCKLRNLLCFLRRVRFFGFGCHGLKCSQ